MLKIRITAVRQTIYQDLMAQYENPIKHACDIQQGQQWISVNGKRPDGLCSSAWETMQPFVKSLAQGKGNFFDGWMKNPMSAMISCNDGFRPFSFYIEAIEESQPAEEKVILQQKSRPAPKDKTEARVFKFVEVLGTKVLPRRQIIAELGMKQKSRAIYINNYLKPALASGYVTQAFPNTPSKPEQAYRLTANGRDLYKHLTGEDII